MPNTPILTPVNTPPLNYDDQNVHGFTPPSNDSQYSSDYNDEWDNYMNNPNVTRRRGRANSLPHDDDDDFIQGRALTMNDLGGEEESPDGDNSENYLNFDNESDYEEESLGGPEFSNQVNNNDKWAKREMPPIPNYPKQIIDVNSEGYDPFMMENVNIRDYLKEDKKDNIAVLYNNKIYLTSRSIINQQENDALVYECLEGDKKTFQNIVGNLPLYNIKKIGLNLTSDNAVGIEAEYIYMDGIDELLESEDDYDWQYYSIIPLPDKQLVSVISLSEAGKVGTGLGSGVSALHCQAGQGGLAGIIVKAYPNNEEGDVFGGKKRRFGKKTVKRRRQKKTMKKGGVVKHKKRGGKTNAAYKKKRGQTTYKKAPGKRIK